MAKKTAKPSTTTYIVPSGWTYLDTLLQVQRSLQGQLRNVELAISCEQHSEIVKKLTNREKK